MPPGFWDWRLPSLRMCVLIVGGIGFAAGFFGPIIFAPDANHAPVVGILISGPSGAFRLLDATLYLTIPAPEFHGYIEEVQIDSCKRPMDAADDAVQYWEKQIAPTPVPYARYGGSACENYRSGAPTVLFSDQYFESYPRNLGWPPRKLVNFLDLQTLEAVPPSTTNSPQLEFAYGYVVAASTEFCTRLAFLRLLIWKRRNK